MIDHTRAIVRAAVDNDYAGESNRLEQVRKRWFSQLGSGFACSALQENRPVWIHSLRLAISQHRDSAVCFAERGEQE